MVVRTRKGRCTLSARQVSSALHHQAAQAEGSAINLGRSGASPHQRKSATFLALPLLQHLAQERRGPANLALRYFFRRAGSDDFASEFAGLRTDIDQIIRFTDYIQIVFNDDDGMAVIN
jgi:hypothetical protein